MDTLLIARLQMAFTLGFHIIFSCFGIVLPFLLLIAEILYRRTKNPDYHDIIDKWGKLIIVFFAIGAVSGTLLSVELNTLWPKFMEFAGPIFGLPFQIEGFAFIFEVIFLSLYFYGKGKVPESIRLLSCVGIFLCACTSGFVVISANGWMNTPTGFTLNELGNPTNIDQVAAMFNPSFITQSVHMTLGAFQAVGFALAGVYSLCLLFNPNNSVYRRAFSIVLIVGGIFSILQPLTGDMLAKQIARSQPIKLAALEGQWETETGAPLRLGGIPLQKEETTKYAIEIPYVLSILAFTDPMAEVKGLKELAPVKEDRPPVIVVHFAFQMMVGAGMAMMMIAMLGALLYWRGYRTTKELCLAKLTPVNKYFLGLVALSAPLGILAIETGWTVTEVGRQPWIIYNIMRTSEAVTSAPVLYQFIIIMGLYALFTITTLYALYYLLMRGAFSKTSS